MVRERELLEGAGFGEWLNVTFAYACLSKVLNQLAISYTLIAICNPSKLTSMDTF